MPDTQSKTITIMVETFKTTIQKPDQAHRIMSLLQHAFPGVKFDIHLDECEKVLRAEGLEVSSDKIIAMIEHAGFQCEILEDKICTGSNLLVKTDLRAI